MARAKQSFWSWYERNYALNVGVAAVLFAVQLVHLVWLTGDPLAERLSGAPLLELDGPFQWLIVLVDYTETPALVSVSLVYLHALHATGLALRPVLYLLFLNSQWLHIFWITDEFVVGTGGAGAGSLPAWLAYVAILIDYLELPVMVDTSKRLVIAVATQR